MYESRARRFREFTSPIERMTMYNLLSEQRAIEAAWLRGSF